MLEGHTSKAGFLEPASLIIQPMQLFEQQYDRLEKIGAGKYGAVFKVSHRAHGNQILAAKFMRCEKAAEKLRVRDEIEILQLFDHQNVLKLLGAFEDEDSFIQGASLLVLTPASPPTPPPPYNLGY